MLLTSLISLWAHTSIVLASPHPPLFTLECGHTNVQNFTVQCVLTLIHKSGRVAENGEGLGALTGGRKVDVRKWGSHATNTLAFITECSIIRQDPSPVWLRVLGLTVKKLAFGFSTHILVVGHCTSYISNLIIWFDNYQMAVTGETINTGPKDWGGGRNSVALNVPFMTELQLVLMF